jgi:hypothetical protein
MVIMTSDCVAGARRFPAAPGGVRIGRLARLTVEGLMAAPTGPLQAAPYVVADVSASCGHCDCLPLTSAANARCELAGACEPGDWLVSAGDGRVEKGAEGCAAYLVGVAEEGGTEGQRVLLRPHAAQPPSLGLRVRHPGTGKWHRVVGALNGEGELTLAIEAEGV